MKLKYILILILFVSPFSSGICQENGRSIARSTAFGDKDERYSEITGEKMDKVSANADAETFINMGKRLMQEGKYLQAKEAFKTAIRLEPMNEEAWNLYDEALIADYVEKKKLEKLEPVIEKDMSPRFEISNIDTYLELDTLYVVGSLKNLSNSDKHKIEVTAQILDKNEKELRRQTGKLKLTLKGLSPNESSLFEIPFKNPPENAEKFRVKVSEYK
jgi:tetratricopeptide (TPR) repeat protein